MARPSIEARARNIALIATAIATSMAIGVGIAHWALGDTNGFYMAPIDRYGRADMARRQPVAEQFWDRQDGVARPAPQASATSTATSAQPE